MTDNEEILSNDKKQAERIQQELASEALVWEDVLSTPSGRKFFFDILRYLGYGTPAFDLNDKKQTATVALKDAADALFARAMTHDRHDTVTMLKENY